MKSIIAILIIFLMVTPASAYIYEDITEDDIKNDVLFSEEFAKLQLFLEVDTTDQNVWDRWYTSGHFARDLARNASKYDLEIGSVILGNNLRFRGYNNYIINYVIINDILVVIDPDTDGLLLLDDAPYKYFRLYPDGTQVPSFWRANFAHDGVIHKNL